MATGLGVDFARALHSNLHSLFSDFGKEKITEGSHLERVCMISDGSGHGNISDFMNNLIKDYALRNVLGTRSGGCNVQAASR